MIHPEKQRGSSEVLKELVYQNLLLYPLGGSHDLCRKMLRVWKVLFNCIQNDPLSLMILYIKHPIRVNKAKWGISEVGLILRLRVVEDTPKIAGILVQRRKLYFYLLILQHIPLYRPIE